MTQPLLSRLLIVALVAAASAPAAAAVTARGTALEDNPRAAWLDRYSEARQGAEQTDRVEQVYKVGADGSLDLQNISGDVRVTAGRGNEIRIEATKRVRQRDAGDGKQALDQLRIEMNQVGGRVEVRTIHPRGGGRSSASVDFVVIVPAAAAVTVRTVSGDVGVTGVRGEVRAESISGDVQVAGTPNVALAKTVSGTVTARDISSETAAVTLTSVSGNIITDGLKVRALEAGTVSGDLLLSGVQVERLDAKSVSGNVEFAATLQRGGRYAFNSHSGNVRVTLATDAGFELDANSFSGSIRSDFPITMRTGGDDERGRGRESRTIRGSFGDAGAVLSVRSFSGSVIIAKR